MKSIGNLFDDEPESMGLRGDRGLWQAMRKALADTPIPANAVDLQALLEETYRDLTGQSLSDPTEKHIPEFATGGMSSGMISPAFWKDRAFPMIVARSQVPHAPD